VQKYIHKFGGNPEHVVLHGDSAGAGSVAHHLTANGGHDSNLFVGAVAESPFWPTQRTVPEMAFQYQLFVNDTGCNASADALSCLRSTDIATIQKYNVRRPFPGGSDSPLPLWYFLPVVDGALVPDRLSSLFEQDKMIHVPLIVTDDTNEGTPFGYNAANAAEVAQFIKNNYPGLDENHLSEIKEAYPKLDPLNKHKAYFPSASRAYGESTFICPGNLMAASMSKHFSPDQVWNYRFNVRDPAEAANGMGVPHVFEIPSIFGLGQTNENEYSFATINANIIPVTMNYYLSFIQELNPNALRLPRAPIWDPWGSGTPQRLKLQTNSSEMEAVPREQLERCSMWAKFSAAMQH
jgi:carboxylesterase type B